MTGLLDEVLAAHGGRDRWGEVEALIASGRFGGVLRARFPGNRMETVTAQIQPAHQQVVFHGFPRSEERAVFDCGEVRIETAEGEPIQSRRRPREAFTGLSGLRRNFHWDSLDATYFAGYAWWNYLSLPLVLTRDEVTTSAGLSLPTRRRVRPRIGRRSFVGPTLVALDIRHVEVES